MTHVDAVKPPTPYGTRLEGARGQRMTEPGCARQRRCRGGGHECGIRYTPEECQLGRKPHPPPKPKQWMQKLCKDAEYIAEGCVYTDGSAEGWFWRGARAAYGAVCYNEEGKPLWALRGVCGEPHPSINRAELMAVIAVMRLSAGAVRIKSDSDFVVGGFKKGKTVTTGSGHEAADLWREAWALKEEIEGGTEGEEERRIAVEKVKAHTTWAEVVTGKVGHMDHVGNAAADKGAKEALAVAKAEALAEAYNAELAAAVLWAKWLVEYATIWDPRQPQVEEDKVERAIEREEEGRGREQRAERSTMTHELWKGGRGLRCRRCGRESTTTRTVPSFGVDACKGTAVGKLKQADTCNKNCLWSRYRYSKEEMIVSGFTLHRNSYVPKGAKDEERLHEVGVCQIGPAKGGVGGGTKARQHE